MATTPNFGWALIDEWDMDWFDQVNALFSAIDTDAAAISATVGSIESGSIDLLHLRTSGNAYIAGDAIITGNVYVSGSMWLDDAIFDDISADTLSLSGDLHVEGTIFPYKAINFSNFIDNAADYALRIDNAGNAIKPSIGGIVTNIESGTGTSVYGWLGASRHRGTQSKTNSIGFLHQHYHGKPGELGGDATFQAGAEFDLIGDASTGTVQNSYVMYLFGGNYYTATWTNLYGLYIGNINTADNLNYAIYTNAGSVRFGDVVNMTANMILAGSVISTFQATDVAYFADEIMPYKAIDFSRFDGIGSYLIESTTVPRPTMGIINITSDMGNLSNFTGLYLGIDYDGAVTYKGSINQATLYFSYAGSSADNTTLDGLFVQQVFTAQSSGNFNNATGLAVSQTNSSASVTINTAYGLYLTGINIGTANYAIFTEAGSVRFGDVTSVNGRLEVSSAIYVNNAPVIIGDTKFPNAWSTGYGLYINRDGNTANDHYPIYAHWTNIGNMDDNYLYGAYLFVVASGTNQDGGRTIYGNMLIPAGKTVNTVEGVNSIIQATGTTTNIYGVKTTLSGNANTSAYGFYLSDLNVAAGQYLYGIYLSNVAGGSSGDYAIYTNAGSVRFGDTVLTTSNLKANGNVYVDADGDANIGYIYFRGNTQYLAWDQGNTRFIFSDNVALNGTTLRINSDYTSGDYDCRLLFNAGQASMTWDYGEDRFRFSKGIYVAASAEFGENISVNGARINVNADYISGDEDAVIDFNSGAAALRWDDGLNVFEFDNNLYIAGTLRTQTSIIVEGDAGPYDISALVLTKTVTTAGASAATLGNAPDAAAGTSPAGWIKFYVGSSSRYIPYW